MRDPRLSPRAGDVIRFEGEEITVTSVGEERVSCVGHGGRHIPPFGPEEWSIQFYMDDVEIVERGVQ